MKCVKREKNKSGIIVGYVFDNGTIMAPNAVRDLLMKSPGSVSNLRLTSDGRILLKKEASKDIDKTTLLNNMHSISAKMYRVTKADLDLMLNYISQYTGLKLKKLRVNRNGEELIYQMGVYTVVVEYLKQDTVGLSTMLDLFKEISVSKQAYNYLQSGRTFASWAVKFFYGDRSMDDVHYVITNRKTVTSDGLLYRFALNSPCMYSDKNEHKTKVIGFEQIDGIDKLIVILDGLGNGK